MLLAIGLTLTLGYGHIHNGKQSDCGKDGGRQFVSEFEQRCVSDDDQALIKRLLSELQSLLGIGRAVEVSMRWLMGFTVACYDAVPEHLSVTLPACADNVVIRRLGAPADERWRFVGKKSNKQWLGLAMDSRTRQVIAFQVGDSSRPSAKKPWKKRPAVYREQTTFWIDGDAAYQVAIPEGQHRVVTKKSRKTHHVERLNGTLRQRLARWVRATLWFSNKLKKHIGAIRFFFCHYNLELAQA